MIDKQAVIDLLEKECRISMRLFSKLDPAAYDYRPSEAQRSTFELIQFMSHAYAGAANAIAGNGWDWWKSHEEAAKNMDPSDFPTLMEAQIEEIKRVVNGISDDDFANKKVEEMPWPTENTVGVELLDNCLRWASGYRMQLFLYAKANGVEISTMDCWFLTEDA